MKLSISNIAWKAEDDEKVYMLMKDYGFTGLEIAPTRIFPEKPYDNLSEAAVWAKELETQYGFVVPSMQSIWYGRQENIFGSEENRNLLLEYTKKAIDFAESIGCKNLVFGCPRNRSLPEGEDATKAIPFFKELGDYAAKHNTVIGMEANPPMYNTNFINDTVSAIELIKKVDSDGFKLNLDLGTMVAMGESVEMLDGSYGMINHVHVSEPGLKAIEKRDLHNSLLGRLDAANYTGYISIEMGNSNTFEDIEESMSYIRDIGNLK